MGIKKQMPSAWHSSEFERSKKIERLVCSGGGAKGVVYPGSYKALDETGLLKGVDQIAGASAGAITVAFIAVGISPHMLRNALFSTNLKDLLGDTVGSMINRKKKGVCFITKSGKPLENFIRETIIESIRISLSKLKTAELLAKSNPDLALFLDKMKASDPIITFGDLHTLHHFFPTKFKELTIPAVRFPTGELQVFNKDLTPDVEIALACRASASIPVILEPVNIEVNGELHKFVDSGIYDNTPTDYFDMEANGCFVKNKKPEKTIVFAFGTATEDKNDYLFQALYGPRWDEVVDEALLNKLIDIAVELSLKLSQVDDESSVLQSLDEILVKRVQDKLMTVDESKIIFIVFKKSLSSKVFDLLMEKDLFKETEEAERKVLLSKMMKEGLTPTLFDPSTLEKLKMKVVLRVFGGLKLPYQYLERNEEGYQKIRAEYPLRTVELHVGHITTLSFTEAEQHGRVMDTFGYLDAIDFITNHDLHDVNKFSPDVFYCELSDYFEHIYKAVLHGASKNPENDFLMQEILAVRTHLSSLGKDAGVIGRQIYQIIKSKADKKVNSLEAFVLSRAVEFHNHLLKADDLFKEVYEEGFKHSSPISFSNIMGGRFFRVNALHEALKEKSMYGIYMAQAKHEQKSKEDKIYEELRCIKDFHDACESVVDLVTEMEKPK